MPDPARCYRCGHRTVEVSYATFSAAQAVAQEGDHIIRDGDGVLLIGWREAEQQYPLEAVPEGARRDLMGWLRGTDEAILCPECEKEKACQD